MDQQTEGEKGMLKPWIKLFTDTLEDEKFYYMSDTDRSVFLALLLCAGKNDHDGVLYDDRTTYKKCWNFLNEISKPKFWKSVEKLIEAEIVERNSDGFLCMKNFAKRQKMSQSKAEKNSNFYQKNKEKNTENSEKIQSKFSPENSEKVTEKDEKIQSEFSPETEKKVTENSVEIQSPEKEKEVEEEINSCDTNVSQGGAKKSGGKKAAEKNRLKPEQPEFWRWAFGPRAEMAQAFWKISGIQPVGKEFGHWQNDLKNFEEAGITIPQMEAAVRKIRKDNKYPIKSPGTVLTEARNIAAAQKNGEEIRENSGQSWSEIAAEISAEIAGNSAEISSEKELALP